MQDMHRPAIKKVAVLAEDEGFRSFPFDSPRWHHENVSEFLDGHMQPNPLARLKPPHHERAAVFLICPRLVCELDEERERPGGRIHRACKVLDFKRLLESWPLL